MKSKHIMKKSSHVNSGLRHLWAAALIAAGTAHAGTMVTETAMAPAPAPVEETPFVTGNVTFSANTHFISYGQDIWGYGDNEYHRILFNPSAELNFNLGNGFSAIVGTWWDVNDNGESNIGNHIQEVDIWAGFGYQVDKLKFTLLYQNWAYGFQNEGIIDFKVAYTHFLNPSLLLHGRIYNGIGDYVDGNGGINSYENGLAVVLGIAPTAKVGPVTFSFPLQVAADTDGFHAGDAGFSFASAGVTATVPLAEHVTFSVGGTYYHTNDDVIPTNPDSDFVTGSASIAINF